ncbi:Transthyretin-like family protein [Ancylostoma duodenale]|uniref:Transthyretin-like family protein n=1 Tax=Ancylostoma duodenale TaxID=51022 RepID=A0A0C2FCL0_9BILA|nr:Transthyretin-like family protein [Ancylostoma duodenale]
MYSVAAQGKLVCNGIPAKRVRVQLYDTSLVFPDKLMRAGLSNEDGWFRLLGSAKKGLGPIAPELRIIHRCNYTGSCWKSTSIQIPRNHHRSGNPDKLDIKYLYNIGLLDLSKDKFYTKEDCQYKD